MRYRVTREETFRYVFEVDADSPGQALDMTGPGPRPNEGVLRVGPLTVEQLGPVGIQVEVLEPGASPHNSEEQP